MYKSNLNHIFIHNIINQQMNQRVCKDITKEVIIKKVPKDKIVTKFEVVDLPLEDLKVEVKSLSGDNGVVTTPETLSTVVSGVSA